MNKSPTSKQGQRILEALQTGRSIPAPELSRIGSGKENGFVASFSRRISDLRKQGHNVVKSKDVWVDGQRQTEYRLQTVVV